MSSTIRIAIQALLSLTLALVCQAQIKLATINVNGALVATRDGQKAVSELNGKRAAKGKQFEQKQNEILALQDQLNKGANTLGEAARQALFASIAAKKKSVQREMEDAQADLETDEQRILQQLGEKLLAVVQRYAHDNGYTMVVDVGSGASPVLYASAGIDITKQVIELYDKSTSPSSPPASQPKAN